jgi:hypothetical protein
MTIDPTFGTRQHLDQAAYTVDHTNFSDVETPADDNELVAQDAAYVCGRCDKRITAGQLMRRRASGGWAHESC